MAETPSPASENPVPARLELSQPPPPRPERKLTEEEMARVEEITAAAREKISETLDAERQQQNLAQDIIMRQAAQQIFYVSSGSSTGIARTLELRNVNRELLKRVLFRNGIEIVYRYVEAGTTNTSPLNAAVTDSGTYTARDNVQPGMYEVIETSDKALANLVRLETEYMQARRLDPAKIRIKKITYGVVRSGASGHWDLGVVEMEYEQLTK